MTWVFAAINFLILLVLALSTLLDVVHSFLYEKGWEPNWLAQMHANREKREMRRTLAVVEKVIKEHDLVIRSNKAENIKTFVSQLGITHDQFDKELKYEIAKLRSLPTRTIDETKAALLKYCTTKEPCFLVDQSQQPDKVYPYVDYYINFIDMVFHNGLKRDLAGMLVRLISRELKDTPIHKINKVIIPIDGNYLLGLAVAEQLGASIVKVRNAGHIYTDKPWEGYINGDDVAILVNDALVTGHQIDTTLEKVCCYASDVAIRGLFFLVERTGDDENLNARQLLNSRNHPIYSLLKLTDNDLSQVD